MLRILRTGINTEFNSITVRNWRQGELGITLASDKAALSAPLQPYTGQERTLSAESHGPLVTGEAGVDRYNWGADASTWVAEPGFADVTGYSNSEYGASLSKFDNLIASTGAGNDVFVGYTGHDTVDAGAGNDLLIGGPGFNVLKAGAGDDIVTVLGASSFNSPLRTGPQDQWSAPAGAGVLSAGPTRGAYRDSSGMLVFGDGGANTLNGSAQDDHLYGGAGADTLNGQAGNDYLEGGAGADTYQFTGSFGHDTVLDAGGQGRVRLTAGGPAGGIRAPAAIWESPDKKYIYVVLGADLIIGQRTAPGAPTVTDTLTVKNWHPGELGLTPHTAAAPAPAPLSHLTVYQAYSPAANDQGSVTEVIDGQSTSTPSGADYTVARTTTTGLASIVTTGPDSQYITADSWDQQISTGEGNDLVIAGQWELPAGSIDADIVNTGAGSDLVFTGQGQDIIDAGDGDDFIMSGGMGAVAAMQSEDPATQVPAGATWVRAGMGSWGLYNDSANGDLGGRLAPYGINTAQFWQTGAGAVDGVRLLPPGDACQEDAIGSIANKDHFGKGTWRFDSKSWVFTSRKHRWRWRFDRSNAQTAQARAVRCTANTWPGMRLQTAEGMTPSADSQAANQTNRTGAP